jgi:hypothetical protein
MTTATAKIYTFRSGPFGSGDTIVTVAPMEQVIAVFGDGGLFGEGGLSMAFNHVAIFRSKDAREIYFGVWGSRRSDRFRAALQERFEFEAIEGAPSAHLTYWAGKSMQAMRRAQRRRMCATSELTARNRPRSACEGR